MPSPESSLTIARPDDWHLHLRDGAALASVAGFSARAFARVVAMPNLRPPVTTVDGALAYRERIRSALPQHPGFDPLVSLYLTESMLPEEIDRAARERSVAGVKCYPAGATTHSEAGVASLARCAAVLARMEEKDVVLQVHGELPGDAVDPYDREALFVERELEPVVARFPRLRIVLEHVSSRAGVEFVRGAGERVGATVTPQHLLYSRTAMFRGGLRPHLYCLPVLKRERDRAALVEAATSHPRFFLGTDSAPHARTDKESGCGCAGVFSAPAALELYARAFEEAGRLERLEDFASLRGADFYGRPRNTGAVTLRRESWTVPSRLPYAGAEIVPLCAGERLEWRLDAAGVPA